jgi:feruloyl esterase
MIEGPEPLFINNDFFRYIAFEDPEWNWRTFDIDTDTRSINKKLGKILNNINPDLAAFRKNGGKLIVYQSWNETWVPPRTITEYYNDVIKTMGGEKETKEFFRLYMVPDCSMCPGGDAGTFDALTALQKWREEGITPNHIQANYRNNNTAYKSRPVCSYPEVAIYRGEGNINRAENFTCGKPTW